MPATPVLTATEIPSRPSWKLDLARYLEVNGKGAWGRSQAFSCRTSASYRNPCLMLFVGPSLVFLFERRFPQRGMSRRILLSVVVTNLLLPEAPTHSLVGG